jgi:hypothetical protein
MKEQIIGKLKATKTVEEWNRVCDEAKSHARTLPSEDRSGDYPAWWFEEVIISGLSARQLERLTQ